MAVHTPMLTKEIKETTAESLKELARRLKDSHQYLSEAAGHVRDDEILTGVLNGISSERSLICDSIEKIIGDCGCDVEPDAEGTFSGKLRMIWSAMRAGLNAGDPTVVLIEAEKAEDVMLQKFREILADIGHIPVSVELNRHYETVKRGHDRILALRNQYQSRLN